jgi:hypothetical protein
MLREAPHTLELLNLDEWLPVAANTSNHVLDYIRAAMRLIHYKMLHGDNLADVAEDCLNMAEPSYGITGYDLAVAIGVLANSQIWIHGAEFNEWYNSQRRKQYNRA